MELRLGTFNVWGLPEPFAEDVESRMRGIARRFADLPLDVLLIQEAWTEEVRDGLREAALRSGFQVAEADEAPGGGLMALSRWPIRASAFERFQFRGDPERIAQGEFLGGKGFQILTLEGVDGPVRVVNTHLHARYRRERPHLNSAVRTAQLLQIVGALRRIEGPVFVGGDFNCTPEDPEYRIFAHLAGVTELGREGPLRPTLSRANFYKRHRTGADKRIDLLFVRLEPGARVEEREPALLFDAPERIRGRDRSLSDHFGFGTTVRVARTAIASGAPGARPDPNTVALARRLLEVGRAEANRRERVHERQAMVWVAGAGVAAALRRHPLMSRRRFLRGGASALALVSLGPALGYSTLARLDSEDKRDAFDDANAVLVQLASHPEETA